MVLFENGGVMFWVSISHNEIWPVNYQDTSLMTQRCRNNILGTLGGPPAAVIHMNDKARSYCAWLVDDVLSDENGQAIMFLRNKPIELASDIVG
ncbi:hypothetical protein AVEN_207560-1 [Araneus ventricosus]|uniref:Uncharacterized protein n=1 Tax=Araneus ventricosus TaxID=182803 RepID=A0A4Y2PZN9_ARAVE|nr:hypothetical protein AVEN_251223-1 [Araneus ventricosus]GBN56000.1 hypothetical protein AVEN_255388-1 [Araneus ventricosus]GBN56065.1 hypothetical protein AVEN_203427-1 [Araneus ventricosus]GBN56070.1 hypothetical protein AVEN_207560-1 [Araneus ventricosus]